MENANGLSPFQSFSVDLQLAEEGLSQASLHNKALKDQLLSKRESK